jgi:hypothetical protein
MRVLENVTPQIVRSMVLVTALTAACGAPRPPEPAPAAVPEALAPSAPQPVAASADAAASESKPAAIALPASAFSFRRELDAAVHSLTFGEKSYVAALGEDAWLDRGKGFEKLPKPPKPTADTEIYFGRDNQPRLMGFERTPSGEAGVYNRFRKNAWDRGADEIARLADVAGPFFGVLGWADPEVVCKRGDQCIIKRKTGWKFLPALANLPRVALCDGQAWAFEQGQLWSLEKDGWRAVGGGPAFGKITGVWGASTADVWVADAGRKVLHHFAGSTWTEQTSPIDGPRAVWAPNANEAWVAGDGGAARFDGKAWLLAADAPKGVLVLTSRDANEVWMAGSTGVWRGKRTPQ